ncbi:MAG: diguanylate cyclase/phosphodiesterase [Methylophaga sp.]|nr:MAG: diguanylate cyclase/phosphodiesterase [Methylophaga sp.]
MLIAGVAIYTNEVFSDTQRHLTEQVLPMENASRQISKVASEFIVRQRKVVASTSLNALKLIASRQSLEEEFEKYWDQILATIVSKEENEISYFLRNDYHHFLYIDNQLFEFVRQRIILQDRLDLLNHELRALDQKIQNQVEAIAGRINLQVSRDKRDIRMLVGPRSALDTQNLINKVIFGDQYAIQKLSQTVRLGMLTIINLMQNILQTESIDDLLSIRENDIRQLELLLQIDIHELKRKLKDNPALLLQTKTLEQDVNQLITMVVEGDASVYQLRVQQLKNKQLLLTVQQNSTSVLALMGDSLDQFSELVGEQSLKAVLHSSTVAESARWLIIILGLLVLLGMIWFVASISKRINVPLTELHHAMRALSSENFDTRIQVTRGHNEFAVLAEDFNQFATNTQRLIDDLAETRDSLQMQQQHIRAILDGVPEAILTLASSGEIKSTNPATERILGAESDLLVGMNIVQFFDENQNVEHLLDIAEQQELSQEFLGRDFHNKLFNMWLSLSLLSGLGGGVWVCVISDITAWKQAEEKLKITSSELDTILDNAMVGIAFIKDRILLRINSKFEELFDCERALIEGQSTRCLYPTQKIYDELGDEAYNDILSRGENFEGNVELIRQNGETFWGKISVKAIDSSNPQAGTIWLFDDVTEQRKNQLKLKSLASFDSLTGLANRAVFHDRLGHAIDKAQRNSGRIALFFLDLDHFKNINDSLGHKAGDLLLCEVASRLQDSVRADDTVARLGGDEFTIILEDVTSARYVAKVAEKILDVISQSFVLETTEVNVSPSIGISLYPADGRDVDLLLRNADAAMYYAKESGRNNFQFYSAEMNAQAAERLAMETSLRHAMEQNEFYLHFQPQINLRTGRIAGAEALLRWSSEQWGAISPAQFIPILEDTGLINEVGEFVIRQACEAYMLLKDKLEPDFQLAVNLSGRQFKGGTLARFVEKVLTDTGMSANNLELEITESILMDDADLAIKTLTELNELGVTLAIDDFGTGYSSLSYLKQFPLDVLKIDRSFVRDVNEDADDAAIVDAILAMSKRLGLDVVAEGVETAGQLEFLQAHDCQRVQGYYFSKPLPFDELRKFIEKPVPNILMGK